MIESGTKTAVRRTGQALAGVALLAMVLGGLPAGSVVAQESARQVEIPTSGMKSGRLSGGSSVAAEISGTKYNFHPKVSFANEEGNPMEWKDFKKGDLVRYHLKGDRLDLLVLVLPQ